MMAGDEDAGGDGVVMVVLEGLDVKEVKVQMEDASRLRALIALTHHHGHPSQHRCIDVE